MSEASPFQGEQSQNPDVPLVSDEYIREDDSYGGLKDLLISGQDDEDPSNKSPNLDIVHVTETRGGVNALHLESIIRDHKTGRRVMLSSCDVSCLLLGNLSRESNP